MQKTIKIGFILYFVIVSIILWTYISYSNLRMNVASTLATDPEHPTAFAVWAYDLEKNHDFSQWTIVAVLVPKARAKYRSCTTAFVVDTDQDAYKYIKRDMREFYTFLAHFNDLGDEYALENESTLEWYLVDAYRELTPSEYGVSLTRPVITHLSADGRATFSLPLSELLQWKKRNARELVFTPETLAKPKNDYWVPYSACFLLIDPEYHLRKEISFDLDPPQETIYIDSTHEMTWAEPKPFLLHEKNELLINVNGFDTEQPVLFNSLSAHTPITTKVIYGRTEIDPVIPVTSIGLARASFTVETASDLQFDYHSKSFYGTFTPNDKPLRLEVSDPAVVWGNSLELYIKTVSGDNDVYLDYYYYNHWMKRTITHTDSIHPIKLWTIPDSATPAPEIIIISGCLSSWDCKENAHRIAIISSPDPISLRDQAIFALKKYKESVFENEANKETADLLYQRVLKNPELSSEELALARDYALDRIAAGIPAVEPSIVRTEPADNEALIGAKENQHAIATLLLILHLLLGLLFLIAAFTSRVGRNRFVFRGKTPKQQVYEKGANEKIRFL